MQLTIVKYMVSIFASKDERQKLNEIFKALDKNNDGVLCKDELN